MRKKIDVQHAYVTENIISGIIGKDILIIPALTIDSFYIIKKAKAVICENYPSTSHIMMICRTMGISVFHVNSVLEIKNLCGYVYLLYRNPILFIDDKPDQIESGNIITKKAILPKNISFQLGLIDDMDEIKHIVNELNTDVEQLFLRSEFMWLAIQDNPYRFLNNNGLEKTVDTIYEHILEICKLVSNKGVVLNFRGLDLRSDENDFLYSIGIKESNPQLGLHGTRQLLVQKEYLHAELLAIDRLYSVGYTNITYSLPFVVSHTEVNKILYIINQMCINKISLGVYIETPAAVADIENILHTDINYIYVGTKDLAQLSLAVDRENNSVAHIMNLMDNSVLSAISFVVNSCIKSEKPVYVFSLPENINTLVKKVPKLSRFSIPAADYLSL